MNLPNKITLSRVILAIVIIILLLFPFDSAGIITYKLFINESIVIDIKYIIAGVIFIIASVTDIFDGYYARKKNMITDFGKMFDAIADKILIDSTLVMLATIGFIHPIVAVIVILRDTIVDSLKRYAASKNIIISTIKTGKIKTILFMISIILILFYNLPFELINLKIADIILVIATTMSIISAFEYYKVIKKEIKKETNVKGS